MTGNSERILNRRVQGDADFRIITFYWLGHWQPYQDWIRMWEKNQLSREWDVKESMMKTAKAATARCSEAEGCCRFKGHVIVT